MGAASGKGLKAKQRRVAGVGEEGAEIVEAHDWCQNFATHDFEKAKQFYDAMTDEEKT